MPVRSLYTNTVSSGIKHSGGRINCRLKMQDLASNPPSRWVPIAHGRFVPWLDQDVMGQLKQIGMGQFHDQSEWHLKKDLNILPFEQQARSFMDQKHSHRKTAFHWSWNIQ